MHIQIAEKPGGAAIRFEGDGSGQLAHNISATYLSAYAPTGSGPGKGAFVIAGRVMDGKKIGRTIGFPTANIQVRRKRLPLSGVFAVTVSGIDERPLPGAANIGVRPTVAEGMKPVLEVHLLDFDRDIYGAHVDVNFLHKLRNEAKFESLDALKAQIARDVADVRTYFKTNDGKTHG